MTAHLYCWHPDLNLSPADATFPERIEALHQGPKPAASSRLLRFVEALLDQYPDVTETEHTVWADGPLDGSIIGSFISLALRWSRYEEAAPFVISTAHSHGLHCYDPQTGEFYPVHHREAEIRSIVTDLLVLLADEDYESIMERCGGSRLTGDDLRTAIREYGRKVAAPPADYIYFRTYELEARAVPTWSVEADLWTEEEGRSDLTLQLTIAFDPSGPVIEIDDLHVM
jgi:hypothetical protein